MDRKRSINNMWLKQFKFQNCKFYTIDLKLRERITILSGNDDYGKTYLFNSIAKYARQNPHENILCIDYIIIGYEEEIINKLKGMINGLVVINQANKVLKHRGLQGLLYK